MYGKDVGSLVTQSPISSSSSSSGSSSSAGIMSTTSNLLAKGLKSLAMNSYSALMDEDDPNQNQNHYRHHYTNSSSILVSSPSPSSSYNLSESARIKSSASTSVSLSASARNSSEFLKSARTNPHPLDSLESTRVPSSLWSNWSIFNGSSSSGGGGVSSRASDTSIQNSDITSSGKVNPLDSLYESSKIKVKTTVQSYLNNSHSHSDNNGGGATRNRSRSSGIGASSSSSSSSISSSGSNYYSSSDRDISDAYDNSNVDANSGNSSARTLSQVAAGGLETLWNKAKSKGKSMVITSASTSAQTSTSTSIPTPTPTPSTTLSTTTNISTSNYTLNVSSLTSSSSSSSSSSTSLSSSFSSTASNATKSLFNHHSNIMMANNNDIGTGRGDSEDSDDSFMASFSSSPSFSSSYSSSASGSGSSSSSSSWNEGLHRLSQNVTSFVDNTESLFFYEQDEPLSLPSVNLNSMFGGNDTDTNSSYLNVTDLFDSVGNETLGIGTESYNYWALLLIIFPVFTVFGNVLVILSVKRERSLHNVTNYFIVSLAVSLLFFLHKR